jgi:hypothetical protein
MKVLNLSKIYCYAEPPSLTLTVSDATVQYTVRVLTDDTVINNIVNGENCAV